MHRKQLGICTSQCVMLVPKLIGVGKNSAFSTYILHLDIFSNSICIQCQATALPAASSAPASPGNTPGAGWGRTGGPFPQVLYLSLGGTGFSLYLLCLYSFEFSLLLPLQCLVFNSSLLQLVHLHITLCLSKLLCGFSQLDPD